jgi:riboflavin kinase/FMN adenylyltransferase
MLNAAISIGRARTFLTDHPLLFEAHILQGDIGDLYGKWLGVDFISHIRPQQRFENVEALKKQVHEDCLEINRVLGENK